MQACADLDPEFAHAFSDRTGTADRARRAVEAREEAVAGDVELRTAKADEFAADECVMALEQLPPGTIAELSRLRRRADDVSEENRGEDAVRLSLLPAASVPQIPQKALDLRGNSGRGLAVRKVACAGDLDDACHRDTRAHVARNIDRNDGVLRPMQDQRRDTHRRQHMPNVDLLVHPVKRLERARARTEPKEVDSGHQLLVVEAAEPPHSLAGSIARAEDAQIPLHVALVPLLGQAPRVIGGPHPPRIRAANDKGGRPLRVGRREQDAHRRPFRSAVEGSPP